MSCELYSWDNSSMVSCDPSALFDSPTWLWAMKKEVPKTWHIKGEQRAELGFLCHSVKICKKRWKKGFLNNKANKQKFSMMLSSHLKTIGCTTHHAETHADLLIAKTTVLSSRQKDTILIGEDTDLLVLLCYYGEQTEHDLLFCPETR